MRGRTKRDKRTTLRQARNKRYAARQHSGIVVVRIQVNHEQVSALEASRWLDRRAEHQRHEIEQALQMLIDDALRPS
jgi:hypothetical protein